MPVDQKKYSISELSKEFDMTTRTIRFYEDKGLISPARQGQHRIYSEHDRVQIKLILRGKRLGLSLKKIQEILSLYDPSSGNLKQLNLLLDKLAERRQSLEQQLEDIQSILSELDDVEKLIHNAINQIKQTA